MEEAMTKAPRHFMRAASSTSWSVRLSAAKFLGDYLPADFLALAWRIAATREAVGHDKFNLGHLKP